jgi:hypothetical protein
VSANTALTEIFVYSNQLTSFDVSANTALTHLIIHANQLTSFDVSANTALTYLQANDNPDLTCIYVGDNVIGTTILDENQFLSGIPCDVLSTLILGELDDFTINEDTELRIELTASSTSDSPFIFDAHVLFPVFNEMEENEPTFIADIIHNDVNNTDTLHLVALNNWFGTAEIEVIVHNENGDVDQDTILVLVNPVNDAPIFVSDMHRTVGLNLEFHIELHAEDIDSEDLVISLVDGSTPPEWVTLADGMLHGTPTELGLYELELSLSDGELVVLDTFHLNVKNFMPKITSVRDVSNDQGGRVYVEFNASFFDNGEGTGQSYSIFRWDEYADTSGWIALSAIDAIGDPSYTFEALTIMDSTSENDGMTEFKVVASMYGGIFHSEPMMGYSVDNILPGVPGGVMAIVADNTVELSWNESVDEDFQYFMVEKTSISGFEMIETAEAFYVDENYISSEVHSYRVAAVDHAGNQSEFSEVVEVAVLAIDNQVTPDVFALHQNYPNPFNPTTQIKYDLAEDALVSISIYDVMGRKIKSLMNINQSAGYHSLRWDATNNIGEAVSAGMYIYTIQAGQYRATKKMVLLK